MKKRSPLWDSLVPAELDGGREALRLALGILLCLLWNAAAFLVPFIQMYEALARMPAFFLPFDTMLEPALVPCALLAGWMLALFFFYMTAHYRGSRSIYLMRRLPDRWELWRRCLTLPLIGLAAALVIALGLSAVYFWVYETYALMEPANQKDWYWMFYRLFYE